MDVQRPNVTWPIALSEIIRLSTQTEDDFQKTEEKLHNRIRRLKRTQEAKEKEVQEKKAKVDEEVEVEE